MSSKIALVTGAYGAIGSAIAEGIASLQGYRVVLLGRNQDALDRVTVRIRRTTGNTEVWGETLDLSSRDSVYRLASRIQEPVSVLVNNAATTPRTREETPEGLEMQFATNIMGYVWMMVAFERQLRAAEHPRVVNVASYWAGDLDLD